LLTNKQRARTLVAPMPWDRDGFAITQTKLDFYQVDFPAFRHIGLYVYRAQNIVQGSGGLTHVTLERWEKAGAYLRYLASRYKGQVLGMAASILHGVDTPRDLGKPSDTTLS